MALEIAGGNCIPDAVSSSALHAASAPPLNFVKATLVSGAALPVPSAFETISEASPPVLRNNQAICLIASNWSIIASWWLTAAASAPDSLSSVASIALVVSMYSLASVGRRSAFGLPIASQNSFCSAVSVLNSRSNSGTSVACCANSMLPSRPSALFIAGISVSRMLRRYFSMSASIGASPFSSRLVVERSVRRLCIALNMLAEASAIWAMRLAACRRPQASQAFSENPTTRQKEVTRMTVFSSADTVRRFNMMLPQNLRAFGGKTVKTWKGWLTVVIRIANYLN